jgi:hypothetical protein
VTLDTCKLDAPKAGGTIQLIKSDGSATKTIVRITDLTILEAQVKENVPLIYVKGKTGDETSILTINKITVTKFISEKKDNTPLIELADMGRPVSIKLMKVTTSEGRVIKADMAHVELTDSSIDG